MSAETLFTIGAGGRFVVPEPRARRTDRATSHAAARSVRGQTETHARILEVLDAGPPATDEQIASRYQAAAAMQGWPPVSPSGLRSRRAELVDMGLVEDSGLRGRTASGRACTVWRAASRDTLG